MDLGVFAFHFSDRENMPFDELLSLAHNASLQAIELGTGGFVAQRVSRIGDLMTSPQQRDELLGKIASAGLYVSALNAIGNPFHPDPAIARRCVQELRQTIDLAAELGINRVVAGGGCPGDGPGARYPNWAVYPYFSDGLWDSQWRESILPFWREIGAIAAERKVYICVEPHPVMAVYNFETFSRVREAGGEYIAVNYDPSHFFWTGIDPIVLIRRLGDAIHHVHAKDTRLNPELMAINGLLDPTPFSSHEQRSWNYCAMGDGHTTTYWQSFFAELAASGYDGPISIEHEDVTVHGRDALEKNVSFLRSVLP